MIHGECSLTPINVVQNSKLREISNEVGSLFGVRLTLLLAAVACLLVAAWVRLNSLEGRLLRADPNTLPLNANQMKFAYSVKSKDKDDILAYLPIQEESHDKDRTDPSTCLAAEVDAGGQFCTPECGPDLPSFWPLTASVLQMEGPVRGSGGGGTVRPAARSAPFPAGHSARGRL